MSALSASLLSYLLIYKYALLAGALFVSGAVPIPAGTLLIAAGAFASQGYLSLALSLISTTLASAAIDFIVYLLGRNYGPWALRFFKVEKSPVVTRLEGYIRDHAGTAIFFTRFVGGLDAAGGILAGLAGVSATFFLAFDLLGNAVSNAGLLFLGYFFGAYWQTISNEIGIVGWILLLVILGGFGISYWRYMRKA